MAVPVIAAKVVASTVGKQAAKQVAKKAATSAVKSAAASTARNAAAQVARQQATKLAQKHLSQQTAANIGKVAKNLSTIGGKTNLYDAASELGQKALGRAQLRSNGKGGGDVGSAVARKATETAVNKGLAAASKLGPAPVKIAANAAKAALKNDAVKGALADAASKLGDKLNEDGEDGEGKDGENKRSLLNPFGRKGKNPLLSSGLKAIPMMIAHALPFIIPLLLIGALISGIGGCAAGMFGLVSGGDSSSGRVLEQDQGVFIPAVQVEDPKGFCDEDEQLASTGSGTFEKFTFDNEEDLKAVAALCQGEQGSAEGAAAEASLVANLYLREGKTDYSGSALRSWLRNYEWFASDTRAMMDNPNPQADILAAVKAVLVDGKHTLPKYVDEHDCVDPPDIGSISTGSDPKDRSAYKAHETICYQNPERFEEPGQWTFYCFPAEGSDPFGYSDPSKREEYGDDCYSFSDLGVGSGNSSSASSGGAYTEREDCIERNKKSTQLGDWVYYNQVTPNWDIEAGVLQADREKTVDTSKGTVHLYQTFGSSCGQVAMAMVCASYGGDAEKYTPTWLRSTEMRFGDQGLNQPGCLTYMNAHQDEFHLKASSGHWDKESGSWEKMEQICAAGGCVVLYQVHYSSGGMHWIVVRGIDGDNVTVANPATGAEEVMSKANIIADGCPNKGSGAACAIYLEKI